MASYIINDKIMVFRKKGKHEEDVFGSRWLVNELSRLGFSITYDEVNRYKQSVIQSENLDSLLAEYFPGTFTQWVADNVDHNVATLDGRVHCIEWELLRLQLAKIVYHSPRSVG